MNLETIIETLNQGQPYLYTREGIANALGINSVELRVKLLQLIQQGIESAEIFESKKHKLATRKHLGFIVGTYRFKTERFGFVECDDNESYYCNASDNLHAFDQDIVLIRVSSYDSSCEVIKVLKHQIKTLVGEVLVNNRKGRLSYRCTLFSYPYFVTVGNSELIQVKEDSFVLFDIVEYGEVLKCKIQSVIAPMSAPFADINSALIEKGILLEYPKDAVSQAAKSGSRPICLDEKRKDLRHLLTMTIDGEDAKDFDDALSVEVKENEIIVYVSIADVATYVEENSVLDKEAYRRGTSIYVPGKVIPMLPFELSNGACSLNPNVDRYAITCELHYQTDGQLLESKVYPSLIKSKYRMTYSNVNRIFAGEIAIIHNYETLVPSLLALLELATAIQHLHDQEGGVSFVSNELSITMDKQGNVESVTKRVDGLGENLIETYMIEANIAVAKLMNELKLPCIYRIHEAPQAQRMEEFKAIAKVIQLPLDLSDHPTSLQLQHYLDSIKDSEFYEVINARLLRSMSKARYESECLGHYGLGLKYYCHFTSPIRRYPDLLVHRYLWKYYFNQGDSSKDQSGLLVKAAHCSECEVDAVDVERDITAMKVCQYMQHKINQKFTARVSSITNSGLYVTTNQGIDIFCPYYYVMEDCVAYAPFVEMRMSPSDCKVVIGDELTVTIQSVNEIERKVIGYFQLKTNQAKKTKVNSEKNKKYKKPKKAKSNRRKDKKDAHRRK